ncbi:MAG TPA: ribosomal protein S18-alanine N-acetyltransferase [Steroidobacter sp.]|jgi:ribosomal-protein-alanine N-acetyltransferase|nr:ribosomal protein S18-alanine N-acetyltransferase [Steroidobacteraceae bacterium]HLS79889.1 ribosomal protein S18-alanine N-acetyltransferase [Steroidobacter sp.]
MSAQLQQDQLATSVRLRPMSLADVPAVGMVERSSYPFPWSEGVFRDCIRVGYLCRVVETAGEVAGYAIMSYGAGEAHVLNICIREDLRGMGVGRRLMEFLLARAREAQMQDVFLEVRPSNPNAIRLYESLGFVRVGVRKGYYQAVGGREDAWVYRLELGPEDGKT